MTDTFKRLSEYGAVPDGRHIYLVSVTGADMLTAQAADPFRPEDVGKTIVISGGTDGQTTFRSTVAEVLSTTELRTADPIPNSAAINHQSALVGTDCATALQAALDEALANGGMRLLIDGQFALFSPVTINWYEISEATGVEAFVIEGDGAVSCLHVSVPSDQDAFTTVNGNITFRDLHFAGLMGAAFDARNVFNLRSGSFSFENVGFYGMRGVDNGHVIVTEFADFYMNRCRFGGCSGNSATNGSVVHHDRWSAISIENTRFIDYGHTNGQSYSKTAIRSARAWISAGDVSAEVLQALKSSVLRLVNLKLDEGSLRAIDIAPTGKVDRVFIDGVEINGWGSAQATGIFISNARNVTIARSSFGYTSYANPVPAIALEHCGTVLVDAVECNATMRQIVATDVESVIVRNSPTLNIYGRNNVRDFRVISEHRGGLVADNVSGPVTDAKFSVAPRAGTLAIDGNTGVAYAKRNDGAWVAQGPGGLPQLVTSRSSTGSFQSISNLFTTILLGPAIIDTQSAYNAATGIYTVPQTGVYSAIARLRVADNFPPNVGLGLGLDVSNADNAGFVWGQTPPATASGTSRFTLTNARLLHLTSGMQLRVFAFADTTTPLGLKSVELVMSRIA